MLDNQCLWFDIRAISQICTFFAQKLSNLIGFRLNKPLLIGKRMEIWQLSGKKKRCRFVIIKGADLKMSFEIQFVGSKNSSSPHHEKLDRWPLELNLTTMLVGINWDHEIWCWWPLLILRSPWLVYFQYPVCKICSKYKLRHFRYHNSFCQNYLS